MDRESWADVLCPDVLCLIGASRFWVDVLGMGPLRAMGNPAIVARLVFCSLGRRWNGAVFPLCGLARLFLWRFFLGLFSLPYFFVRHRWGESLCGREAQILALSAGDG